MSGVRFSHNDKAIISCSIDKSLKTYTLENVFQNYKFEGHLSHVNSVSMSPNGKITASCSEDFTAKLYSTEDSKLM